MQQNIQYSNSYRIAKKWQSITVNFTSHVTQIIPFNDYLVMLIFKNNKYQIWNLSNIKNEENLIIQNNNDENQKPFKEGVLGQGIKFAQIFSKNEILYYDQTPKDETAANKFRGQLKVFNPLTDQHSPQFEFSFPTVQAIPENAISEDKVLTLREGIEKLVLSDTQTFVTLEPKNLYSDSNDIVVSFFCSDGHSYSSVKTNDQYKQFYLKQLNNSNKVIAFQNAFFDQKFQFEVFTLANTEAGRVIQHEERIIDDSTYNCVIIQTFPQLNFQNDNDCLCVWLNHNDCGIPSKLIIDLNVKKIIERKELKLIESDDDDEKEFMLNDVIYYDSNKNIAVIAKTQGTQQTETIDVYNPQTNKITFTQLVDQDLGILTREFSHDGKYFIEYESQSQGDDSDQAMLIELQINCIVTIQASLAFFMKKAQIESLYGETITQLSVAMLTMSNQHEEEEIIEVEGNEQLQENDQILEKVQ